MASEWRVSSERVTSKFRTLVARVPGNATRIVPHNRRIVSDMSRAYINENILIK